MKVKKEKKPLNIAQRVEILLREGVDNPKKWATVHGYEEPDDVPIGGDAWQDEYQRLRKHHLAETSFLFEMLKEMREQILTLEVQLDAQYENDRGVDG